MDGNLDNKPQGAETSPRPKAERLKDIFSLIQSAPPASTAEEAFTIVKKSFDEVEEKEEGPRMRTGRFESMIPFSLDTGKDILYIWYIGHVLLIGHNGSIELREKSGGFEGAHSLEMPRYARRLKIIIDKPGSDNKGVWD